MLIIFEGLDKSGKSTMANLLHGAIKGSMLIRKTYAKELYPIDYGKASEYDWQALFDRVILANPDATFIADRSFFTQTVYQVCLGTGVNAITDAQMHMYNAYCDILRKIPHLIVYCKSARYEYDSMVTNPVIKQKLDNLYRQSIHQNGLNCIEVDMDADTMHGTFAKLYSIVSKETSNTK
jgi:thymidylate kinase